MDRIRTYQELHENYIRKLKESGCQFVLPDNKIFADFETWVQYQPGGNKAFVLLDIETGQYAKWHLIKEKFGYTNDEFTAAAVNNLGQPMLIHPDQNEHKERYTDIIIELLRSETKIEVRVDSYSVEFKLKHKNGDYIPVRRTSIIFQTAGTTENLSTLDQYEILGHDVEYVYPEISMIEPGKTNELMEEFYKENLELLNLSDVFTVNNRPFDKNLIKIFYHKLQHPDLGNKEIARKLDLHDEHVVERSFNRISERIRFGLGGGYDLQGVQRITVIARTYGLFPIPKSLVGI